MRSIPFLPSLIALSLGFATIQAQAVELDIPAQALDSALTDFAEQAGVRLLYDASLTREVATSVALKGDYPVDEGLQRPELQGGRRWHRHPGARGTGRGCAGAGCRHGQCAARCAC